ncbi:hypothetical protein TNCV_2705141 [Trichonephila clavipes]|nr:hypothetical protein TNCV_2705141 [Trichonephila clavipes]
MVIVFVLQAQFDSKPTVFTARGDSSVPTCEIIYEGVAWHLGEGKEVPAHVPSSSLDYGSKLRGPSPKPLV